MSSKTKRDRVANFINDLENNYPEIDFSGLEDFIINSDLRNPEVRKQVDQYIKNKINGNHSNVALVK